MSTIERDELEQAVVHNCGVDMVTHKDARRIVDDLKAKLAHVTRERDAEAVRADQMASELSQVQAEAAAMRARLDKWCREAVCPVNENLAPGFVSGAYDGWGRARNQIANFLQVTTAGRDLQEEMRRKDERIAELEAERDQMGRELFERRCTIETLESKSNQPTPEPVWKYRRNNRQMWKTNDGRMTWAKPMGGVQWYRMLCDDEHQPWQACVDDPATYACDERGKRIEEASFGQQIVDSLQAFNGKLASGEEIRGTRVTIKDGEVASEKDVVVIPARKAAEMLAKPGVVESLAESMQQEDEAWPTSDDPPPSKCKSCGIPYTDHIGIQGTCRDLQDAKRQLAEQAPLLAIARELRELLKSAPIYEQGGAVIAYPDKVGKVFDLLCKLRDTEGGGS